MFSKKTSESAKYTVYSRPRFSKDWIKEKEYNSLEEAEKAAFSASMNVHYSKVVDDSGKVVSKFYDLSPIRESRVNEDYPSDFGVDDIEDVIASGQDWVTEDPQPYVTKRFYDDASKLITIAEAETILGKRPKKGTEDLRAWEKKFTQLVGIAQNLKNLKDDIAYIEDELQNWGSKYYGTYVVRKRLGEYSWIQDPVEILLELVKEVGIPEKVTSLSGNDWSKTAVAFDEDTDPLPSVLLTVGSRAVRVIAVSDNLNVISDEIEPYLPSITKEKLLKKIEDNNIKIDKRILNSVKFNDNSKDLAEIDLYVSSLIFQKTINNLNKYPNSTKVDSFVKKVLDLC